MKNLKKINNNISLFFRSLTFNIMFVLITFLLSITFLPISIFSKKTAIFTGYMWSQTNIFLLKIICKINLEISGLDNIPKNENFVIASKHQSTWDTIFFLKFFINPAYILKKELLYIPLFGQYLMMMGMLYIDRSKGKKSLEKISSEAKKIILNDKRNLVIFPEGTRTAINQKTRYKSGIYTIAKNNFCKILPVALNSGKYWPKGSFFKYPGTIKIHFLPHISQIDNKDQFMKNLEKSIEESCRKFE